MTNNAEKKNLDLWEKVGTTPPQYTKGFNQGFSGTAINSTYLIRLATEHWGMIGLDWGYDISEERVDSGAPVYNANNDIIGNILTHTIKLCLWVKRGEEYARIEHFGHTPYVYYSAKNNKWITDQEAPKKSLTDALKKCLSMYGFSADIYLGLYDDQNYVEEVKAQVALDNSDNKADEEIKQRQEYEELYKDNLNLIKTATNMNELEKVFVSITRKAKRRNDEKGMRELTESKNKRKDELTEKGKKK